MPPKTLGNGSNRRSRDKLKYRLHAFFRMPITSDPRHQLEQNLQKRGLYFDYSIPEIPRVLVKWNRSCKPKQICLHGDTLICHESDDIFQKFFTRVITKTSFSRPPGTDIFTITTSWNIEPMTKIQLLRNCRDRHRIRMRHDTWKSITSCISNTWKSPDFFAN